MAAADQKITAQLLLKSTKSNYLQLAERLGVARGKKEKICEVEKLKQNTPRPPRSVHKKNHPNRSNRLAGYTQQIYFFKI